MEKIEGMIEGVEVKEGVKQDGSAWKRMAYTIGGKKYSTFLASLQNCKAGDFVVMTYKTDGKYNTVETIQVAEKQETKVQPEVRVEKVGENNNFVDTQRLIVRQNALQNANNFMANATKLVELGIIPKEKAPKGNQLEVLGYAKIFEDWVFR